MLQPHRIWPGSCARPRGSGNDVRKCTTTVPINSMLVIMKSMCIPLLLVHRSFHCNKNLTFHLSNKKNKKSPTNLTTIILSYETRFALMDWYERILVNHNALRALIGYPPFCQSLRYFDILTESKSICQIIYETLISIRCYIELNINIAKPPFVCSLRGTYIFLECCSIYIFINAP